MSRAKETGHAVTVEFAGREDEYPEAAFIVDETGALQVWRVDGTLTAIYAPGQWRRVTARGTGLGPT